MSDQSTINQQLAAHVQSVTATQASQSGQSAGQTAQAGQSVQGGTNTDLIRELVSYIQLSSMQQKEKAMWLLLLPSMEEKHLLKLKGSLQKEVNAITDLYINALSKKA